MSVQQFRALVAVGDCGSFSAAAAELHLTQSAVSMQIRALEERLDVALFDRSRRPPRLTATGERLLQRARGMIAQYDELYDTLVDPGTYRGTFRLGAVPTTLTNLVPSTLMLLRQRAPDLLVNVSSGLSGVLLRRVNQGELDGALMHRPQRVGTALAWRDVMQQRVVVVAPPGSEAETARAAFRAHPYIRFNRSAWIAPMIEKRLARMGIRPDTRIEIESIEAIQVLVSIGFGISVLPDVSRGNLFNQQLRYVDLGKPTMHRTIGLLVRAESSRRSAGRIVGDAMCEAAGH